MRSREYNGNDLQRSSLSFVEVSLSSVIALFQSLAVYLYSSQPISWKANILLFTTLSLSFSRPFMFIWNISKLSLHVPFEGRRETKKSQEIPLWKGNECSILLPRQNNVGHYECVPIPDRFRIRSAHGTLSVRTCL